MCNELLFEHLVSMVLCHIGGQLLSTEVSTNQVVYWHAWTTINDHMQNNISEKLGEKSCWLKKSRPRCYAKSRFGQYQPSSAALGWLGDGHCYLMLKMQSDGLFIQQVETHRMLRLCAAVLFEFTQTIINSHVFQFFWKMLDRKQ